MSSSGSGPGSGRFHPLFYVFFFALFPVLSLLSANINEMALAAGLRAALFALLVAGGLLLLLGWFSRQWARAGLIVSLLFLFILSFGHIYKFILDATPLSSTDLTYSILVDVWLLLLLALIGLVWFRLNRPERFTQNLNIISLAMLLLPTVTLAGTLFGSNIEPTGPMAELATPNRGQTTSVRPDIYYIILDGYGRADILSAVYNFDNSPFINQLEARGFFVASQSRTNYISTIASLASSLNLQYHDELAQTVGTQSTNLLPLSQRIEYNQVQTFLKSLNYETITISSGYNNTEARTADRYLTSTFRGINNFETLLLQHTPFGRFIVRPGGLSEQGFQYAPHRDRILFTFDSMTQTVPAIDGPKFVFAHIVAPHPPFVFKSDGQPTQPDYSYTLRDGSHFPGTAETYISGYREQVSYINQRLLEAVDAILAQSQFPPIIIIQSDHGPGAYLDWRNPETNNCLKERASNFVAILTPDQSIAFYDTITPVNIFRLLFKSQFEIDIEPLEDKTFFASPDRPYDFTEITDQIESSDACLTGANTGQ